MQWILKLYNFTMLVLEIFILLFEVNIKSEIGLSKNMKHHIFVLSSFVQTLSSHYPNIPTSKNTQIKKFYDEKSNTSFKSIYSIICNVWGIRPLYVCTKNISVKLYLNNFFLSLLSESFETELKHIRYLLYWL